MSTKGRCHLFVLCAWTAESSEKPSVAQRDGRIATSKAFQEFVLIFSFSTSSDGLEPEFFFKLSLLGQILGYNRTGNFQSGSDNLTHF